MTTSPAKSGAFLDVEPDILKDRLCVVDGAPDRELSSLTMPAEAAALAGRTESIEIHPERMMCCKTKDRAGAKVFVNVCTSSEIPPPETLREDELREMLQDEARAANFRVPMSLGDGHKELDKTGGPCTAYDVVIHPQFYTQVEDSLLFKTFFMTVIIEAIEDKFKVELDKNQWVTLRNKVYFGKMPKHYIRRRDLPMVQECSRADAAAAKHSSRPLISEVETKRTAPGPQTPPFTVTERDDGRTVVTLQLPPAVTSQSQLSVEVGEDRLVVSAETARLLADVELPRKVDADSARAAFSLASHRLAVSLRQAT